MGDLGVIKQIPHPSYGYYGGYYARCKNKKAGVCPRPIDWLDGIFKDHDNGESNRTLVLRMLKNWVRLGQLKRKIYGPAYWAGTLVVFSIPAILNL